MYSEARLEAVGAAGNLFICFALVLTSYFFASKNVPDGA